MQDFSLFCSCCASACTDKVRRTDAQTGSADILLDAFVRMICRVRVEFAKIQTFQMLEHLVEALLGHSAKEFYRVNAMAKIHFTRLLSQSRRLRPYADRPMIHRLHTVH